jgi:hypothetical protein
MRRVIYTVTLLLLVSGLIGVFADRSIAGYLFRDRPGNLTPSSQDLGRGHRYDSEMMRLRQGQRVRIWMKSTEIDPFLYLNQFQGARAITVAKDNNSAGGLDAFIDYRVPADGTYVVIASTYPANQFGSYRLSVLLDD